MLVFEEVQISRLKNGDPESEVFFKVSKDPNRKFNVMTSDVSVKVLGARFNLNSYPDENTKETTLVEDSNSIHKIETDDGKSPKEYNMEPNQRMVINKNLPKSTPIEIQPKKVGDIHERKAKFVLPKRIDPTRWTSWNDDQLIVTSKSLNKLALTMGRRYDVRIHFEDDIIEHFRFSGNIENESTEQVMAAIKPASFIDFQIKDRKIWISKGK